MPTTNSGKTMPPCMGWVVPAANMKQLPEITIPVGAAVALLRSSSEFLYTMAIKGDPWSQHRPPDGADIYK